MTWVQMVTMGLLAIIAFVLYMAILSNMIGYQVEKALRRFLRPSQSNQLEGESYVLTETDDKLITWIAIPGPHGMNRRRVEALAQRINRALSQEEIAQRETATGYAKE